MYFERKIIIQIQKVEFGCVNNVTVQQVPKALVVNAGAPIIQACFFRLCDSFCISVSNKGIC